MSENNVDNYVPGKNGGRLNRGGTKGNKGGGRPKDEVRAACCMAFDRRIPRLKMIADGKLEGAGIDQQLKAIDMLARYGGLVKVETEAHNAVLDDLMTQAAKFDGDVAR
jgi:hypothetical protein